MPEPPMPERPAAEPEIIPPGRDGPRRSDGRSRVWVAIHTRRGGTWSSIASPGPFAIIVALLVVAALAAITVLIVLGTVLLWLPVLGLLFALLFVSGLVRGFFRRPRS